MSSIGRLEKVPTTSLKRWALRSQVQKNPMINHICALLEVDKSMFLSHMGLYWRKL
jgi:hypothetical protein